MKKLNYYEWNFLIASYLFNKEINDSEVFLCCSQKKIIELYCSKYNSDKNYDAKIIWNNFISAINDPRFDNGDYSYKPSHLAVDYVSKMINLISHWQQSRRNGLIKKNEYPIHIAYLVILILPFVDKDVTKFTGKAIYESINKFSIREGVCGLQDIGSHFFKRCCYDDVNNDSKDVWQILENWSKENRLGKFYNRTVGQIYVGKIKSQILLKRDELDKLPLFYRDADLYCGGNFSNEEYRIAIYCYCKNIFRESTVSHTQDREDEFGNGIISIIKENHKNWDGTIVEPMDVDNEIPKKNKRYIPSQLILSIQLNYNNNSLTFGYRCRFPETPIDLIVNDISVYNERNQWSNVLENKFRDSNFDLKDKSETYRFNFNKKDIYLLAFDNDFTPTEKIYTLFEQKAIRKYDIMYLLVRCDYQGLENILDWGNKFDLDNEDAFFKQVNNFDGIPNGYCLFCFKYTPSYICDELKSYKPTESIDWKVLGGLPLGNGKYLKRNVLPYVYSKDISAKSKVIASSNDVSCYCEPIIDDLDFFKGWALPSSIVGNYVSQKIEIKVEDKIEICLTLCDIELNNKFDYLKRNVFGQPTDTIPYISNNVVIKDNNCLEDNSYIKCNFNCEEEYPKIKLNNCIQTSYDQKYPGNLILEWLYYKGSCTKKEFEAVFDTLYVYEDFSKVSDDSYKNIKKASLDWLDYAGYVDYDYMNGRVYSLSPRLIKLPVLKNEPNKALLIGCRSFKLIDNIISYCKKENKYVCIRIIKQNEKIKRRLFPDAIIIEAVGYNTTKYGIYEFETIARDILPKTNDSLPLIYNYTNMMLGNMPKITQFRDEGVWVKYDSDKHAALKMLYFDTKSLSFIDCDIEYILEKKENDLYLVELNYRRFETLYALVDVENKSIKYVDKNWGRYYMLFHLYKTKRDESSYYLDGNYALLNETKDKLAIKAKLPLPTIINKYLIFLSGYIPYTKEIDNEMYYIYNFPNTSISGFIRNPFFVNLNIVIKTCNHI